MRFGPGVHFSASDVREGARERDLDTGSEGNGEKEKGGKRKRDSAQVYPFFWKSAVSDF